MRDAWKDRHAFVHDDRRKEPMLDARGCREQVLKWLDLMRDAMAWSEKHVTT